jgi:hypothetical protein
VKSPTEEGAHALREMKVTIGWRQSGSVWSFMRRGYATPKIPVFDYKLLESDCDSFQVNAQQRNVACDPRQVREQLGFFLFFFF